MDKATANKIGHEITKQLVDEGKLIEAGFAVFQHFVIPKNAPPIQIDEMRLAFMAGAEHVWSSMMTVLDPGDEPSAKDLARMDLIEREIERWRETLKLRVIPTGGSA